MTEQVIFTNPTRERTVAEYVTYSHKEAGFWMRFWAFLIDTILISAVIGIAVNPLFYLFDWDLDATNWYAPIVIISGVFYYAYFILMTKFFAQTVGKMIFGLKVRTDSGAPLDWSTVIFREGIGRFLSNTFMKLPYLIVVFTPQHKSLHDYTADTFVIHEQTYKETRNKRYVEQQVNDINTDEKAFVSKIEEQPADQHIYETSPMDSVEAPTATKVVPELPSQPIDEVEKQDGQK